MKNTEIIRTYTYDDHGRLIRSGVLDNLDEPDEGETIEDLIRYTSYEYDAAGNRIKVNDDSGETTFSYNGLDQTVYMDAPEKEVEYIYDLRGNQTEANDITDGVITRNDYTVEGQLVKVSEEDVDGTTVIQQNAYDAEGTRVQKTEGSDVKKYYYAGSDIVTTTENGNAVFTGIYDGGEIVGAYLGSTPTYDLYCKDMQGSTSVISASDLSIAGGYSYSDYGEASEFGAAPNENEICYTGAVYDRTTGEHYLRARYYDPETAVFTAQDTLRGEAIDSSLWNAYAYCSGDPVNRADPSGHDAIVLKSNSLTALAGYLAVLIQGIKNKKKWLYFTWDSDGYENPLMGINVNARKYVKKYGSRCVIKKKVKPHINKIVERKGSVSLDLPYEQYLYLKGSFRKSIRYIHRIKIGKSFTEYDFFTCNCAFMALQVLRMGLVGDKYKDKRAGIMKIQYHKSVRKDKYYANTVVPADAFRKLAKIWGVESQKIK